MPLYFFPLDCGVGNNKRAGSTNDGGTSSTTSPLPSVNRTQRVVGGRVTLPNQYPWMVGLLSKEGKLPYCENQWSFFICQGMSVCAIY